jgi:hypothetical protein
MWARGFTVAYVMGPGPEPLAHVDLLTKEVPWIPGW